MAGADAPTSRPDRVRKLDRLLGWFETRIDCFPAAAPVEPPSGLLQFCWHYARPMMGWVALMACFAAAIAVAEVSLMAFLGDLVDRLAAADRATFLSEEGGTLVGWGLLMLVGLPVIGALYSFTYFQGLIGTFPMRIRWLAHRWLLGQSLEFFGDEFAGRVATKVMQTALAVRDVVLKLCDVMVYVSIYFLGGLVLLGSADLRLVVPMIVWLVAYAAATWYFVPKLERAAEVQSDARSAMTGRVVDSYSNIHTVKLFAHAAREERYVRDAMGGFLRTVHAQFRIVTAVQITLFVLNGLALFAVAATSIGLWLSEAISLGAIAVAVGLVLRLQGMAQWILWEVSSLFENLGTVADGAKTIARSRKVVDRPDAGRLEVTAGEVRYEKVSFHYGKGKGVIDGLDLTIRPGEKVGLVGRSGAGKSTLVNLLLRFYDVEGGRILVDGQDVSRVTQDSLRSRIGMVTQDTALLHRSVRDNIRYGRPDATEEEIARAIADAHADRFIPELVDQEGRSGLDAFVGERGVRLSGGQRQRVALARVFLKNAPILLLDEATSALDSEVEAAIQESLYALMEGKTVIAIAHRLSTIAHMDRLIVLDRGTIVEEGSHAELLAHGGLYASLWSHQSGGFLGAELDAAS